MKIFEDAETALDEIDIVGYKGRVRQVVGITIESTGPKSRIGELCDISLGKDGVSIKAEVVGFKGASVMLMPLGEMADIYPGSDVSATGKSMSVRVGNGLLGRIMDGLGNPIDGKGPLKADAIYPIMRETPDPLKRTRIREPLHFGVKAIDGILTVGKGQRIGIFSGSGVGKSTLLGMISRFTSADINVIGLIGERGREVREFIERDLGEEGLKRSVVVVATSDKPPLVRLKGAFVATAIAEYFRDRGMDVMLMVDSITRFARAQREIGLAIGEPPATRGFTPSMYEIMPRILERSGTSDKGSITAIYTVLIEADDMNEPVADTVRAILDGHVVLSRKLAHRNHYPAIDVLESISRVMVEVVSDEHLESANKLKEMVSVYRDSEDLINIGAYAKGSNPKIDKAISMIERINAFLRQGMYEKTGYEETKNMLTGLFRE